LRPDYREATTPACAVGATGADCRRPSGFFALTHCRAGSCVNVGYDTEACQDPAPVLYLENHPSTAESCLMRCLTCASGNDGRVTTPRRNRVTGMARPGVLGVIVCRQCGAVHPLHEAQDPGIRFLAQLASVGLGAGTPPVLSTDQGDRGGS
jgi:hypothetical protein